MRVCRMLCIPCNLCAEPIPDSSEPAYGLVTDFAWSDPMPTPAPSPATSKPSELAQALASVPADHPGTKGWHSFPADAPRDRPATYLCRRKVDGKVVVQVLAWAEVVVAVPGAIVKARGFINPDAGPDATIYPDVVAWHPIPESWLK